MGQNFRKNRLVVPAPSPSRNSCSWMSLTVSSGIPVPRVARAPLAPAVISTWVLVGVAE